LNLRELVAGANASMFYRLDPKKIKAVVYPSSEGEALEVIAMARERSCDITPKGAGSGLSGACTGGDRDRVIISTIRMNRVLSISKDQGYADVQPGITPDEVNALLAPLMMKFHVTPSSRDVATVGGMLSTDAGGNDAWVNGTMRDNTLRVKMLLYDGRQILVGPSGVKSEDRSLEDELNKMRMTMHDVADAHGTLGFISELRLAIKPVIRQTVMGALIEFSDCNELGKVIQRLITAKSPVSYGETVVYAHPDIGSGLKPPMLILEFPETYSASLKEITDFRKVSEDRLAKLKDLRLKLAKRTPKRGLQMSLFEDYGFHGDNVPRLQDCLDRIDSLLQEQGFEPFAKYGHAPSKWYLGDNTRAYGVILHSNEIRPTNKSRLEIFETVTRLVQLCEELGLTPKPEHKWIYANRAKLERIRELREAVGSQFNSFILESDCNAVLGAMV
jgi:hypothetical protein